MSISPSFTLGEGDRNLFLIAVMGISPIIILRFFKFDKLDYLLLLFLTTIVVFPSLLHPDTMRWSTVLYSIMFGFTFIAYKQLLRQNLFSVFNYCKILKLIIYAYFIVLLIQQFCVLTGLPIFNISNYDLARPWKLNSLSAEPSHSGRIVGLLMYSYIVIKEKILNRTYDLQTNLKKEKWIWIAFFWIMLTMGSATAILVFGLVLLKFLRFKNLIPLLFIAIIITFIFLNNEGSVLNRTLATLSAAISFDEISIIRADHSASIRIVPIIILIKMIDLSNINGWFGHGVDNVSTFLSSMLPGVNEGISGGGLFQLFWEYGFISFAFFIIYTFKIVFNKNNYIYIIFWLLMVVMYGVNNQILWLCLILINTNNYFDKQINSKINIPHE